MAIGYQNIKGVYAAGNILKNEAAQKSALEKEKAKALLEKEQHLTKKLDKQKKYWQK